jgi:transcriptional regulator with XRE-family HTH domain
MGNARRRQQPKHLPRKLLAIRKQLGVSQTEMAKLLRLKQAYTVISSYERGTREPDLLTLLRYARLVNTPLEVLVDDELKLRDKQT